MGQLSKPKKVAYSAGGLALNFANLLISQWLLRLYSPDKEGALVPPILFSLVFLAGRVVDGLTEPLVGYASDRLRSRHGKRKPFIALALLPTAFVSCLMWMPPRPDGPHWQNAVYIAVLVQLFFIFWSCLANPYMSLLPQLTSDKAERVDISTLQALFLMVGTVLSAGIGNIKAAWGWAGLGYTVFAVTIIAFLPTLFFVKDPSARLKGEEGGPEPASLADDPLTGKGMAAWVAAAFRNPPFVILLSSTALFWFALNIIILLVPFWVQYVALKGDEQVILAMIPYIAANVAGFPLFNWAAKRWGKKPVFLAGTAASALVLLSLLLVGRIGVEPFLATQIAMGLFGFATSGFLMLPNALLADVVDYDAARTGRRREAIHFGVQAFFQKLAIGASIVVSSALMYAGGSRRPTVFGLKLVATAAGAAALLAALVFILYPLRDRDRKD
jgi:GPH family glycoside/pentoside/hexuronide:cation symporter